MKVALVLCAVIAVTLAHPEEKYTTRYDDVNIQEILDNPRILEAYFKCLMDRPDAKCTPDAKELKAHIKDALESGCAKCTPKQRDGAKQVIKHLVNHKVDYWNELSSKYDPQKKYTAKYEQELREIKTGA